MTDQQTLHLKHARWQGGTEGMVWCGVGRQWGRGAGMAAAAFCTSCISYIFLAFQARFSISIFQPCFISAARVTF